MNVDLHIERLVLEGIDLAPGDSAALEAALTNELARLLAEGGIGAGLRHGGAMPAVEAGRLDLKGGERPAGLGQGIARAVYAGMGPRA